MSISLTWATYALIVSACLFIYYAIIAFVYRKTFLHFFARRTNFQSFDSSEVSSGKDLLDQQSNINLFGEQVPDEELNIETEGDESASDAQQFAGEIEAYTSSCGGAVSKEEITASLRKIIQKYPSLIHSESKYELTQLIAMYCENCCSIHLSAGELQALWNE